jgi:hypothetical protein
VFVNSFVLLQRVYVGTSCASVHIRASAVPAPLACSYVTLFYACELFAALSCIESSA